MPSFTDLGVPSALSDVLAANGIDTPTPIQAAALPDALAGRDVLGRGRTGSGKTLTFLLPLVARLRADGRKARPGRPRALILAPTRELATQIDAALSPLAAATGLRSRTVFGGVGQAPQVKAIARGVDVLVACPGRLFDLIGQGACSLDGIEITVLDEADHMTDLGFLPTVRKLLAMTPRTGQRLLFSATLDRSVEAVAREFLRDPATHQVDAADAATASATTVTHHVLRIDRPDRVGVLLNLIAASDRTVVFTRTKYGARGLARQLNRAGASAAELHGNLGQNARTRNLDDFHSGRVRALVATDIAARGIHVDDVGLVVHADPPADHKSYTHRSGRTARAGHAGTVITLATPEQLREVQQLTRAAGVAAAVTPAGTKDADILDRLADTPAPSVAPLAPAGSSARASEPTGSSRPSAERARRGGSRASGDAPRRRRRRRPADNCTERTGSAPSAHSGAKPAHAKPAHGGAKQHRP